MTRTTTPPMAPAACASRPRARLRAAVPLTLAALCSSAALAGPAPQGSPEVPLDPALRPAAQQLQQLLKQMPGLTDRSVPALRAQAAQWAPAPLPGVPVARRSVPGPAGAPDVPVYVIGDSQPGAARPALLYIHGGGYVLGATAMELPMLQETAAALGCVIVSADYRLAPETRFPGPLEDNYAALRWLHAQAESLGVDRQRIAVAGSSAGGGLAAMLALAARDRGEVPLRLQVLLAPMLDDRTASTRAVPAHIGTIGWDRAANRYGWGALLGVPAGAKRVPAGAVPARAAALAGLPPTFIAVGSIDLFVQEDIDYAKRLVEAGVPTELMVVAGGFHGLEMAVGSAAATRYVEGWRGALRRAFEAPTSATTPAPAAQ